MAYAETLLMQVTAAQDIGTGQTTPTIPPDAEEVSVLAKVSNPTGRLALVIYLEESPNGVDWYQFDHLQVSTPGNHILRTARKPADNFRVRFDYRNATRSDLDVQLITRLTG